MVIKNKFLGKKKLASNYFLNQKIKSISPKASFNEYYTLYSPKPYNDIALRPIQ